MLSIYLLEKTVMLSPILLSLELLLLLDQLYKQQEFHDHTTAYVMRVIIKILFTNFKRDS